MVPLDNIISNRDCVGGNPKQNPVNKSGDHKANAGVGGGSPCTPLLISGVLCRICYRMFPNTVPIASQFAWEFLRRRRISKEFLRIPTNF